MSEVKNPYYPPSIDKFALANGHIDLCRITKNHERIRIIQEHIRAAGVLATRDLDVNYYNELYSRCEQVALVLEADYSDLLKTYLNSGQLQQAL